MTVPQLFQITLFVCVAFMYACVRVCVLCHVVFDGYYVSIICQAIQVLCDLENTQYIFMPGFGYIQSWLNPVLHRQAVSPAFYHVPLLGLPCGSQDCLLPYQIR